ncbi:MAG: hypothetical protein WCF84_10300 [Anaerolineae bacterium]
MISQAPFTLRPGSTLARVRRGPVQGFYFVRDGEQELSVQIAASTTRCDCGVEHCVHGKAALDFARMQQLAGSPAPAQPAPEPVILDQSWYVVTLENKILRCSCAEFLQFSFCPHVRLSWRNLEPSRAVHVSR